MKSNASAAQKPAFIVNTGSSGTSPPWNGEGTAFACDYVNGEAIVRRLPVLSESSAPMRLLKEKTWTIASLSESLLTTGIKVMEFPHLKALRDKSGCMFVLTREGHPRHPAASALIWPGRIPQDSQTYEFLQKVIGDRWVSASEHEVDEDEKFFANLAKPRYANDNAEDIYR